MKRLVLLVMVCLLAMALFFSGSVNAGQVTLAWDANSESDVAGYRLYYGTASGNYMQSIDVGNNLTATVSGLPEGVMHYFAAIAYDADGNESGFSVEVAYALPYPDVDGDGLNSQEEAALGTSDNNTDSDGDGLGDWYEVNEYGTDPAVADTDGDDYSDGQEVALGSDPVDDSSFSLPPPTPEGIGRYNDGEKVYVFWAEIAQNNITYTVKYGPAAYYMYFSGETQAGYFELPAMYASIPCYVQIEARDAIGQTSGWSEVVIIPIRSISAPTGLDGSYDTNDNPVILCDSLSFLPISGIKYEFRWGLASGDYISQQTVDEAGLTVNDVLFDTEPVYFQARYVAENGIVGEWSGEFMLYHQTQIIGGSPSGNDFIVNWAAYSGADGYVVYWSTFPNAANPIKIFVPAGANSAVIVNGNIWKIYGYSLYISIAVKINGREWPVSEPETKF